jgi:hypothetical protein
MHMNGTQERNKMATQRTMQGASLNQVSKGRLYHVIVASGRPAGWLEKVRTGWALTLKATPTEVFTNFRNARTEALHSGARY